MVDRSQMITSHSEEVVNAAVEKKKALGFKDNGVGRRS